MKSFSSIWANNRMRRNSWIWPKYDWSYTLKASNANNSQINHNQNITETDNND